MAFGRADGEEGVRSGVALKVGMDQRPPRSSGKARRKSRAARGSQEGIWLVQELWRAVDMGFCGAPTRGPAPFHEGVLKAVQPEKVVQQEVAAEYAALSPRPGTGLEPEAHRCAGLPFGPAESGGFGGAVVFPSARMRCAPGASVARIIWRAATTGVGALVPFRS